MTTSDSVADSLPLNNTKTVGELNLVRTCFPVH